MFKILYEDHLELKLAVCIGKMKKIGPPYKNHLQKTEKSRKKKEEISTKEVEEASEKITIATLIINISKVRKVIRGSNNNQHPFGFGTFAYTITSSKEQKF